MMEFEDEHEEEEEEEEDDEMVVTPTFKSTQLNNNNNNNIVINSPSNIIMAHHHESKPKPGPIAACRYRECLKNHAVGLGGHAVDGCGEFMPAGVDGSLDALKCAACNCHRNFHRKELLLDSSSGGGGPHNQLALFNPRPHIHPPPPHQQQQQPPQQVFQFYPYNRTSASNPTPSPPPWAPQVRPLALPSPAGERMESVEREQQQQQEKGMSEQMQQVNLMGGGSGCSSSGKKRHRTKFTQEQKDKMFELAERLGWRIQKQDEEIVQHFCNETGVKRHVLKVWMHNNKHTLGKKP